MEYKRRGFIYALRCPETKNIRYIGLTTYNLKERLSSHLTNAKKHKYVCNVDLYRWIHSLLIKGLEPEIIQLFECPIDNLRYMERYFYWKYSNTDLLLNRQCLKFEIARPIKTINREKIKNAIKENKVTAMCLANLINTTRISIYNFLNHGDGLGYKKAKMIEEYIDSL